MRLSIGRHCSHLIECVMRMQHSWANQVVQDGPALNAPQLQMLALLQPSPFWLVVQIRSQA